MVVSSLSAAEWSNSTASMFFLHDQGHTHKAATACSQRTSNSSICTRTTTSVTSLFYATQLVWRIIGDVAALRRVVPLLERVPSLSKSTNAVITQPHHFGPTPTKPHLTLHFFQKTNSRNSIKAWITHRQVVPFKSSITNFLWSPILERLAE